MLVQTLRLPPPVVVTLLDTNGNPIAGKPVVLKITSGSGNLGGTPTQTTDATGNATFPDLSIDKAGSKQITATAGGLSTPSSLFTISAGTPALSFLVQPTPVKAGTVIAPPVQPPDPGLGR